MRVIRHNNGGGILRNNSRPLPLANMGRNSKLKLKTESFFKGGSEMSLSISQMRDKVAEAYSGDSWKKKVRFMPDDQIIAIFYRLKKNGKIKDAG